MCINLTNVKKIHIKHILDKMLSKINFFLPVLIKNKGREKWNLQLSQNDFILITIMILFCLNYGYTYVKVN